MLVSDLVRAAAMAGMAVGAWTDVRAEIVYALAAVSVVAATGFRPAQRALLPGLARTPEELTASNVATSTIDSVAVFAGPALGGLLLAATDAGTVFAANGVTFLWSAYMVMRLDARRAEAAALPSKAVGKNPFAGVSEGFRVVAREPGVRAIVLLTGAQVVVYGALSVLVVVLALDLLDLGESGVGYLNSALGIGGLVGSVLALSLVGHRRLAAVFGIAIALWGLPLVAVGLAPEVLVAAFLLGVVGLANTLVDVSGLTILQRTAPEDVLARVFGVFQMVTIVGAGVGALAVPVLLELFGDRGAFVAVGALLPVLVLVSWRSLAALDRTSAVDERAVELLRAVPFFRPLPASTVEGLAGRLERAEVPAGTRVFARGDAGDRFYVVDVGELELQLDGQGAKRLGPGDFFGEIALLRDVPRTGTVTAATDATLHSLGRDEFLAAVTGAAEATQAAESIVGERLAGVRPAPA
jgi:hypothetical protein